MTQDFLKTENRNKSISIQLLYLWHLERWFLRPILFFKIIGHNEQAYPSDPTCLASIWSLTFVRFDWYPHSAHCHTPLSTHVRKSSTLPERRKGVWGGDIYHEKQCPVLRPCHSWQILSNTLFWIHFCTKYIVDFLLWSKQNLSPLCDVTILKRLRLVILTISFNCRPWQG